MDLPRPERPGNSTKTFLISYVVWAQDRARYRNDERDDVEISQRFLQQMLRRSDGGRSTEALRVLRKDHDPWLIRTKKAQRRPRRGARYAPGVRTERERATWAAIGRALFGPPEAPNHGGILGQFLYRPAMRWGALGINGFLVCGALRATDQATAGEVAKALGFFMTRPTVSNHLKRLVEKGLAATDGRYYSAVADFDFALAVYERESGLRERAIAQDLEIRRQWAADDARIYGTPKVQAWASHLRTLPCVYCSTIPEFRRGEVEHFPPRHWGGDDAHSLLFPSCGPCNRFYGHAIQGSPAMPVPSVEAPVRFVDTDGEAAVRRHRDLMLVQHWRYVEALEAGAVALARSVVAADAYRAWAALVGGSATCVMVDQSSGEFVALPEVTQPFITEELIYEARFLLDAQR